MPPGGCRVHLVELPQHALEHPLRACEPTALSEREVEAVEVEPGGAARVRVVATHPVQEFAVSVERPEPGFEPIPHRRVVLIPLTEDVVVHYASLGRGDLDHGRAVPVLL